MGERYPEWGRNLLPHDAYARAVRRLGGRPCTFHVGSDMEIQSGFPDRYSDWVYYDSDHSYDHVRDVSTSSIPR
jgi:hypothetical protein